MDETPKAAWTGELKIGNATLTAIVLKDGRRLFEKESMDKFVEMLFDGTLIINEDDAKKIAEFQHGAGVFKYRD